MTRSSLINKLTCKNAARQLNVLYRFQGIFELKQRAKIYNYCPIVWHLCLKFNTEKI